MQNDDRFTILRINDGFLNLLGYTHDELSSVFSNSYLSLIHPDDRQQVLDLTHQQMKRKALFLMNTVFCVKTVPIAGLPNPATVHRKKAEWFFSVR